MDMTHAHQNHSRKKKGKPQDIPRNKKIHTE